uniref:Uncharacterized protein n=1 Tax=Oryza barthii TaxID=65489 RepID=A0A0D3GYP9_9ORYZ
MRVVKLMGMLTAIKLEPRGRINFQIDESFKICHERQHDGILAPVLQNLGEAWNILFDRNMD